MATKMYESTSRRVPFGGAATHGVSTHGGWGEIGKLMLVGVSVIAGWHFFCQPEDKVATPASQAAAAKSRRSSISGGSTPGVLKVRLERIHEDKAAVAASLRGAAMRTNQSRRSPELDELVSTTVAALSQSRVAEDFKAEVDGHVERKQAMVRAKLAARKRLPTDESSSGEPSPPQAGPSLLYSVGRIVVDTATRQRVHDRADRVLATLVNRGCRTMEPGADLLASDDEVPERYDTSAREQLGELLATKLHPAVNHLLGLQPSLKANDLNRGVSKKNRLAYFVANRVRLEHPNLLANNPSPENLKTANLLCSRLLLKMQKGEVETHPEWASMRECDLNNALRMAVAMIFVPTEGELDAARLLDSREVKRLRSAMEHTSAGRASSARV